jgi:hypothetical protein
MKRPLRIFRATVFSALSCCACHGAVFERDWQTPGDGLLTYDNVNRREWLDLSESLLDQFPGSTLEAKYQSVVTETLPGREFAGFVVAAPADVLRLAQSAGIDVNTTTLTVNELATRGLVELMEPTFDFPPHNVVLTAGMLSVLEMDCNCRLVANISVGPSGAGVNLLSVGELSHDFPATIIGAMLYRPVPEPSALPTALIGALMLLQVGYRLRRQ